MAQSQPVELALCLYPMVNIFVNRQALARLSTGTCLWCCATLRLQRGCVLAHLALNCAVLGSGHDSAAPSAAAIAHAHENPFDATSASDARQQSSAAVPMCCDTLLPDLAALGGLREQGSQPKRQQESLQVPGFVKSH